MLEAVSQVGYSASTTVRFMRDTPPHGAPTTNRPADRRPRLPASGSLTGRHQGGRHWRRDADVSPGHAMANSVDDAGFRKALDGQLHDVAPESVWPARQGRAGAQRG